MSKSSQTGGVKPMAIEGRYGSERERVLGMTDEERAFRRQWLKDQLLAPNEPRHIPDIERTLTNPIRRFYKWPLDQFGKMLTPMLGAEVAGNVRYAVGKALIGLAFAYGATYYFKYHANDWTRSGGWTMYRSRTAVFKGDPEYPKLSDKSKPSDYGNQGFDKCELNL